MEGGGVHQEKIGAEAPTAMKGTGAHTDMTGPKVHTAEETTDTDTGETKVRTGATMGQREARTGEKGADPPARERGPGHAKGPRAARQGDQPEGTAGTQSDRDPDQGLVAKHVQELPRTGRAGAKASPTQIAGTGRAEKHTPRRMTAVYPRKPWIAKDAAGDTEEENSSVNSIGIQTSIGRTSLGEPQHQACGILNMGTRSWPKV